VFYVILLASAFAVLGEVYGDMLRAAGATERLMELLHTESNLKIAGPTATCTLAPRRLRFASWRRSSFTDPSRPDTWALDQLSGQIHSGQTVAVVGPSGAGKTTLFDLLMRFHDPQSGRIVLDGVPIAHMDLHDLRERMAIVPQEPVIFSGTVLDNIRYGRPDASLQEVHAAALAAYAQEFIRELPEGFDTYLGDRGAFVRRAASAHRDRACHFEKPAAVAAGRSHQRAGCAE
jgi:ATP-binding cassette subfamily B protein